MNTRTLSGSLAGIGAALCVAEAISTVQLWVRGGADSYPLFALAFAALFAVGALLLRSGRAIPGALLIGALATFEVVDYPQWAKHGTFDWIFDTTVAAVALGGVGLAIAVLVTRAASRGRVPSGQAAQR